MASWKMPSVMNTSLIKKWVYFIYYGLRDCASFCVYIYGGSKQTGFLHWQKVECRLLFPHWDRSFLYSLYFCVCQILA